MRWISGILGLLLLTGCAGAPQVPCRQDTAVRDARLDREHAARVELAVPEPDKGPSPEGVEAIALLEQQVLSARSHCPPSE